MKCIASALQPFKKGGQKQRQAIAPEIVMLGRTGLDINDPTHKYTSKALPGKFSGLHLPAIMYTAFRQIDPTTDTGADFAAGGGAGDAVEVGQAPDHEWTPFHSWVHAMHGGEDGRRLAPGPLCIPGSTGSTGSTL